jgi:hypothetical protein
MTGSANNGEIGGLCAGRARRPRLGRCDIHRIPLSPECTIIVANRRPNLRLHAKRVNWAFFQMLS